MKILVTSDYFPLYGANVLLEIGKRWVQLGHEVHVLSSSYTQNGQRIHSAEIDGISCIRISGVQFFAFDSPFFLTLRPWRILAHINRLKPDVISCHFHTSFISTLVLIMKGLGMIHRPVVFTFHGFEGRYGNFMRVLYWLYWRTLSGFFSSAEGLTSINREYEKLKLSFTEKMRFIPNASTPPSTVPLIERFEGQPLEIREEDVIVLFVGQLRSAKGLPVLIEAMPSVLKCNPSTKFVIVGAGPMEQQLRSMISERGLDARVVFTGFVSEASLHRLMAIADVFVLPSYVEGVPLAMLDAMAAGLPIVATDVGGISEFVTDGQEGFLVPPGDGERLARALTDLVSDDALRQRIGESSKRRVSELNWERISEEYLQEFSNAMIRTQTTNSIISK